jgi:hypothetical protein
MILREMNTSIDDRSRTPADSQSRWDRLTGRMLKNWAGSVTASKSIRGRLLSKASSVSRGLSWLERAYWSQLGSSSDYLYYPGGLNPIEARGHSLYSLTLCTMLQPGIVTYA